MKKFVFYICIIISVNYGSAQDLQKLTGFVFSNNGDRIVKALVYVDNNLLAKTDTLGMFNVKIKKGKHFISIKHKNYFNYAGEVNLEKDTTIAFVLKSKYLKIEKVVIKGRFFEPTFDKISMNLNLINKIPGVTGEPDFFKLMQILPGVQMGAEGTTGLYVRGGDNSQNLALIDGVEMYKLSHIFNFMTSVNPFVVKDFDFYKGGFPGFYGNRLSSVMDIKLKNPSVDSSFLKLNTGILATNLFYNLRINQKNALYIAGRTTYIDKLAHAALWTYKKVNKYSTEETLPVFDANFYDVFIKATHYFTLPKSDISFLFYSSQDIYGTGQQAYLNVKDYTLEKDFISWGSNFISLTYRTQRTNPKFSFQTYLMDYFMNFGTIDKTVINDSTDLRFENNIFYTKKFNTNFLCTSKINNHKLFIAADYNAIFFSQTYQDNLDTEKLNSLPIKVLSTSLTDKFTAGKFRIMSAFRMNIFQIRDSFHVIFVPRFSVSYLFSGLSYLRLSYDRTTQPFFELPANNSILNFEFFKPFENFSQLAQADQFSTEVYYNNNFFSFSISGFYKKMWNLADLKFYGRYSIYDQANIDYHGKGWAYGVEFFVQKELTKLKMQSSLTLARTFRQFPHINQGLPYPFKYDRPVNFNILLNYKISPKLDFSLFWTYMSGFNLTIPVARFWASEDFDYWEQGYYINQRNNYRTDPYHRLDLSLSYIKFEKKYKLQWTFGLYNAYNRFNVYGLELYENSSENTFPQMQEVYMRKFSLYPIIPVLSVRIEWF